LQNSTLDTSGTGVLSFASLTSATLGGLTGPGTLALSNSTASAVALSVGNNNASSTFSGMLNGTGSLNKIGSGTLVLSGTDIYTGGTIVTAGTLIATNSNAIPHGTSLTVGAGGTFIFDPSAAGSPVMNSAAAAVPESSTLALLGVGAIGLLGCAWRRRTSRKANL
jgi:autotransporter-associated beta strand protein